MVKIPAYAKGMPSAKSVGHWFLKSKIFAKNKEILGASILLFIHASY